METNNEKISYDDIAKTVDDLINKSLLTDEEKQLIALFAINYCNKNILHTNDLAPADIKAQEIVHKARSINTIGSQILINTGSEEYNKITEHQNNFSSNANGRPYIRQLTSDNYKGASSTEEVQIDNQNPSINGFTNILLILLVTIACGLLLAAIIV